MAGTSIPLIQAGDAKSWVLCHRRAWFDRRPPVGFSPPVPSAFDQLLWRAGAEHEQAVATQWNRIEQAGTPDRTYELMRAGAPVIGQAVLDRPEIGLGGRPDFLVRQPDGRYQIVDAKLASRLKGHPEITLQLAIYRRLLGNGLPAIAALAGGVQESVGDEANEVLDQFLAQFSEALRSPEPPPVSFSESKCGACPYDSICRPDFERAGELSMLHGVSATMAVRLKQAGVPDISALANADENLAPAGLAAPDAWRRAVLQARAIAHQEWFVLAVPDLPEGHWIHFDVESNPLSTMPGGEVYLWGLLPPPHGRGDYVSIWSDGGPAADHSAWLAFLDKLEPWRVGAKPVVIAHYSAFERTQLKLYADRYGDVDHPTVQWLLGSNSPLFDLRTVVQRCLVLPLSSYGLKAICKHPGLVGFAWEVRESGSQWSVVRYMDFLSEQESVAKQAIRDEIESYNRDDVRATRALEMWMRGLANLEADQ